MAEFTANALQTVLVNQNVLFTDTPVSSCCNNSIMHREGSGLVQLRGLTNQCRARFLVTFGANIAVPTGGTATDGVSLAIAVDGEPLQTAAMISTPSAVAQFNNVAASVYVDVPRGCCTTVGVVNNGTQTVDVQNANIIVERVA